jgi:hypothetical protein
MWLERFGLCVCRARSVFLQETAAKTRHISFVYRPRLLFGPHLPALPILSAIRRTQAIGNESFRGRGLAASMVDGPKASLSMRAG